MNHVWKCYDAQLLKKKEEYWNDWYFQFNLVYETLLCSASSNKLNWNNFWRISISFMHFGISHVWKYIDISIMRNYCELKKRIFVLLHFCATTTVIYFKSVWSHHWGHKLLHSILWHILFLQKSFFENI